MDKEALRQQVLHLHHVEKLSQRQIAEKLTIGRKRIRRILSGTNEARSIPKQSILDDYRQLIVHWYNQYPRLQAIQVYERLKEYGYAGSYPSVVRFCRAYRPQKRTAYHPLSFVPGEEAQIDWFFFNHQAIGQVAGFLYVLAYSRYAWGIFYPKTSFEFFLDGHLKCFAHLGGLAHRHRYDNVKSVVLRRYPAIEYNPNFLDFSRFYGFSIYVCNPYKGNEKGRVERVIRDIRAFLYAEDCTGLEDLNNKFQQWLRKRNQCVHRATGKTPQELLLQERLIALPGNAYLPRRIIPALASKTALVEFETNKYSVPASCALKSAEIAAYPAKIEISVCANKVAVHQRCFGKRQLIHNPLHAEKLLNRSPHFKMQRILQLIMNMNPDFKEFILLQEDEPQRIQAAYELFQLLKTHSRIMLISAVRELNSLKTAKIKALRSLLHLPQPKAYESLWPQKSHLLEVTYEERSLKDYDPDPEHMESA